MSAQPSLLPRSTPAAEGVSSRAIAMLLDQLEARRIELHSLMVVRHGHVVAEGWWAPYEAGRRHLLYSLTKSFTSIAAGIAVGDGLLAPDDRVVDVLPDHVPDDVSAQARRLTLHHLLSMTTGRPGDSLGEGWQLEPDDLTKGFLRLPFPDAEGTRHAYDNATTYIVARMVERVTGRGLPEWLDERLFRPMGVKGAEWDRLASGAAFGFHGLHLTTEAVAAFGELLLRNGRWGDRQLVPGDWVELATRRHIETYHQGEQPPNPEFQHGYGYQFWMTGHGYQGHGAYSQQCLVVPEHDLVIAATAAGDEEQLMPGIFYAFLLPGIGDPGTAADDEILAGRLRGLSLAPVPGSAAPGRSATAKITSEALPDGTEVVVDPVDGGWQVRLGPAIRLAVGHDAWRESAPLGRPVVATGAWQGDTFVADLCLVTTPHRLRLVVDAAAATATATWNLAPLTGPDLRLHVTEPLMTRPDVS